MCKVYADGRAIGIKIFLFVPSFFFKVKNKRRQSGSDSTLLEQKPSTELDAAAAAVDDWPEKERRKPNHFSPFACHR